MTNIRIIIARLSALGSWVKIDNISIRGISTFRDQTQGSKRARNSVHIVGLDDVPFCHLGDLGHELSPSQVNETESLDVLFLPVGGFYAIGSV